MPCSICKQQGHNRRTCSRNEQLNSGQQLEEYTDEQLLRFKAISDSTYTFNLKSVSYSHLDVICKHYNIPIGVTRRNIIDRIISHRCMLENEYIPQEGNYMRKLFKYFLNCDILGIPGNYRISGQPNIIRMQRRIKWNGIIIPLKSELVTMFKLLCDFVSDDNPDIQPITENFIFSLSREEIYTKTVDLIIVNDARFYAPTPPQPEILQPAREHPVKSIKNLTRRDISLYWTDRRIDAPDYSECRFLCTVKPGYVRNITYHNAECYIIACTPGHDEPNCYYMDIKSRVLFENKFSDRGNFEVKSEKKEIDKWKEAALKCDFLIKELKRLGIETNDNFACIIDMHQDIIIPEHGETDKEIAGIPSTLTNIT